MPSSPCSLSVLTFSERARNTPARSPSATTQTRPVFSRTNSRPEPSPAPVTYSGCSKPSRTGSRPIVIWSSGTPSPTGAVSGRGVEVTTSGAVPSVAASGRQPASITTHARQESSASERLRAVVPMGPPVIGTDGFLYPLR